MNINIVIFSILISVICVLLPVLQYHYYLHIRRTACLKKHDPYFRDLILSPSNNSVINYELQEKHKEQAKKTHRTRSEVQQCLNAAIAYRLAGKVDKAMKLFEHAAAIAPDDPDVLNHFGKFLEVHQDDLISADALYFKALTISPDNDEALDNRKRTSCLVDQLDLVMLSHLEEKRDLLKDHFHKTVDFEIKKNAFYLHIYHSVGIEGNTMTLGQLKFLLETGRAVKGKSIMEHNEIIGLEMALRYVKILSNTKFIDLVDILEIHKRVMGHVDPLSSGVFRNQQVFVGSHIPPPLDDLVRLMDEFVKWINSDEAFSMHPVRLAALAHYKLVDIHPFADGNGRTGRLIMNLILLKFGYPPVIIYKTDRQKYYEYLNIANAGDVRPFVRFIAYCTDVTLNAYLGFNNRITGPVATETDNRSHVIEIDESNDCICM